MPSLTLRELWYTKGKTILIILGMTFSIFMVLYSSGMWNGVLSKSTEVIDQYDYDIWIQDKDCDTIMENCIVNDSVYQEIKDEESVEKIERIIQWMAEAETEDYSMQCIFIGYELNSEYLEPWDLIEGDISDLKKNNSIIIDETFRNYLEDIEVGDSIIINRVEMEIVGMTKNGKFMGSPYVWGSIETARKLAPWAGIWSSAIGVKLKSGISTDDFKNDIKSLENDNQIPKLEVMTTEEIRQTTYDYIVNEGGMGGSIYIIVAMGFFIALIIISVSMYQTIQEKIPEFGTLKAIGASKGYLNRVLLGQVFIYVSISFVIASMLTVLLGELMNPVSIIPVKISLPATFILYGVTLLLTTICSLISIRKVHKIDPAIVFRG